MFKGKKIKKITKNINILPNFIGFCLIFINYDLSLLERNLSQF